MADRAGRPARPGADWARNHGRYVLARRWSGLGDCLVSLLAAHRYAKATGRALVVDWRHSSYAPPERNLFALVFEPPGVWDGVPVLAGRNVQFTDLDAQGGGTLFYDPADPLDLARAIATVRSTTPAGRRLQK